MEAKIRILKSCVVAHFQGKDKQDVIHTLCAKMRQHNFVKESFEEAVLCREERYPTGLSIGKYNIAIPHTEPQHVNTPCIGIATLDDPVSFRRMDACDQDVHVDVVLLLALNQGHTHMEILSKIIRMCQDESFIDSLRLAVNEEKIVEIVIERLEGGTTHES